MNGRKEKEIFLFFRVPDPFLLFLQLQLDEYRAEQHEKNIDNEAFDLILYLLRHKRFVESEIKREKMLDHFLDCYEE